MPRPVLSVCTLSYESRSQPQLLDRRQQRLRSRQISSYPARSPKLPRDRRTYDPRACAVEDIGAVCAVAYARTVLALPCVSAQETFHLCRISMISDKTAY